MQIHFLVQSSSPLISYSLITLIYKISGSEWAATICHKVLVGIYEIFSPNRISFSLWPQLGPYPVMVLNLIDCTRCVVQFFATPWTEDPMECNLPGSSGNWILQARILQCVTLSFPGDLPDPGIEPGSLASPALAGGFCTTGPPGRVACVLSRFSPVCLCVTLWTVARQAPLSMWFSRQE